MSACGLIAGVADYTVVDEAEGVNPASDQDGSTSSPPSSSTSSSGATSPDDDGGGDGGASSDANASVDARADADAALTLAPPDRERVTCGAQSCNTNNQRCCVTASSMTCLATLGTNCPATEINCDEEQDCPAAEICCLGQDLGNPSPSTGCVRTCNDSDTRARVCKTAQECPVGQPCIPIFCKVRVLGTCNGRVPDICK